MWNCETGHVNGIAWHPQGTYIATAGRALRIWNPVDGTLIQGLDQTQDCQSLAFTEDGAHLIAVDSKGECSVIDTESWKVAANFTAHRGECKSVAVFGNTKFATSGYDGMLKVWSLPECKNFATLYGHRAAVNAVCWDPSGNYLASVGSDKRVNIWNLAHHSIFRLFAVAPSHATDVIQLKDGLLLGVILESQDRKVLDLTTDTLKDEGIQKSIFDLQFVSPETDLEALVKQANLELSQQSADLLPEFIQSVIPASETTQKISVAWSPDRTRVACNNGGDIRVWNIVKQQQIFAFTVVSGGGQLKWAQDSRKLGFGGPGVPSENTTPSTYGWAYIFDTDKGETVHRMLHGDLQQSLTAIEWDPRGNRIATAGSSGDVFCWAAESGKRISNGQILRAAITSMAWSPDESRLAVAGGNGLIKIIDPVSCEELLELSEAKSPLKKVMWSSDGQRLIGVDSQGNIVIWDASKGYAYAQSEENSLEQQQSARNALSVKINELDASSDPSILRLIDQFLQIYPDDLTALQWRANVYLFRKDFEQMVVEYERLTQIQPENPSFWNNYAVAFSGLGRHQETVNALSRALEIDPAAAGRLLNRASTYMKLGDSASARKDVLAVANRRKAESGNCLLAIFDLRYKNQASYMEICNEMLKQKSDDGIEENAEFLWTLALGLNAVPSYQRPIELARKLLEKDKKQPTYQRILGAILFRANERVSEEAVQLLTSSVNTDENGYDTPVAAYYFLAMCHHQLGSKSEAQQWLNKANAGAEKTVSLAQKWHNKVNAEKTVSFESRLTLRLLRDQANELISGAN